MRKFILILIFSFLSTNVFADTFHYFIGSSADDPVTNNTTEYQSLVSGGGSTWNATESNRSIIVPTAGTLSNFKVQVKTAPGAGTSRTFKIEKNGVDSNISITISGTDTTGDNSINTLSISAGDQVAIQQTETSGSPAVTVGSFGIVFVPDVSGEWITAAVTDDILNLSATEYSPLTSGNTTLTNLENEQYGLAQATTAKAIYVALSNNPGVGYSWKFTLRKNGITNTELTTTISGASNTTNNFLTDVDIVSGDLLTTEIDPTGSPASGVESQISYLFDNTIRITKIRNATLNNCTIQ